MTASLPSSPDAEMLVDLIAGCRQCAPNFAATVTAHQPRPVPWFRAGARLMIVGQAPGARVHAAGVPFRDASGARLRDWLGLDEAMFYDRDQVAIVPMAFCFPGYDRHGSDLPPPAICAATWRAPVLAALPGIRLTVLVGGSAQRWYLGKAKVADTVADWRRHAGAGLFPLPHPSWRNTGWLARNPWFATDLLPDLRAAVRATLEADA